MPTNIVNQSLTKLLDHYMVYGVAKLPALKAFGEFYETAASSEDSSQLAEVRQKFDSLIAFFRSFDPINANGDCAFFDFSINASPCEIEFLAESLSRAERIDDLLSCDEHAPHVHALVSFALPWSEHSLMELSRFRPTLSQFVDALITARTKGFHVEQPLTGRESISYALVHCNVPFIRTGYRVIRALPAFCTSETINSEARVFSLIRGLNYEFIGHLEHVEKLLLLAEDGGNLSASNELTRIFNASMPIPISIEDSVGSYEELKRDRGARRIRFVTGQACCGKTTLLTYLTRVHGWRVMSRGDVGSFAGKASDPSAVANLHASLEYALTRANVLGDRGPIDNPLWLKIMDLCRHDRRGRMSREILEFVDAGWNEAALAYYISLDGVVFVDPKPQACRKRMLSRAEGGDIQRARIKNYQIAQTMAYYTVARLFGWRVYAVPYRPGNDDDDDQLDAFRYKQIAEELTIMFSEFSPPPVAEGSSTANTRRFGRPTGNHCIDLTFAKTVGIFK